MASITLHRIFYRLSRNGSKLTTVSLLGLLVVAVLSLVPTSANAQREGGFDRLESPRTAVNILGWVAIGSGIVGTGSFMVYSTLLRRRIIPTIMTNGRQVSPNGGAWRLSGVRKPLLNLHLAINSIGFFSGMAHGFFLARGLDIVSLTLAISMTVAIASGMLLKFGSRRIKFYNIQLHGNISLVLLIILLTAMHILFVRGVD